MLFPDKSYSSLEDLEERNFAVNDPKGFLARFPAGAILDEIQRAPDLLPFLQGRVDEAQQPGQFIITGSQNFEFLSTVSQSLAGRTAIANLLPFSLQEINKTATPPARPTTFASCGTARGTRWTCSWITACMDLLEIKAIQTLVGALFPASFITGPSTGRPEIVSCKAGNIIAGSNPNPSFIVPFCSSKKVLYSFVPRSISATICYPSAKKPEMHPKYMYLYSEINAVTFRYLC